MFINLCISIFAYFIVPKYYYFVDYTWFDNSFENVFFVEQSIYLDDIKVDIYFISLVSLLFCLLCSASLCIGMNPVPRSPAILLASRHRKYFLYHITLYHIILYHIILYHITLHRITLYYIIFYCVMLYYIILYYIIFSDIIKCGTPYDDFQNSIVMRHRYNFSTYFIFSSTPSIPLLLSLPPSYWIFLWEVSILAP